VTVRWASLALILGIVPFGCGDDKAGGPAPVAEVAYSNGHPVALSTSDEAILSVEDELFRLTNEHRASIGLPVLGEDAQTRNVARGHSAHMAVHDFFSHTNPEGEGPGDRLLRAGVRWRSYGENIAAGYPSAQAAFQAWLSSPGHRANIEGSGWTHVGNGYWEGRYTQVFLQRP
jgi:uncharacterized protein YkwD